MALTAVAILCSTLSWLGSGLPRATPPRSSAVHLSAQQPLAEGTWEVSGERGGPTSLRVMVAGQELSFESGVMAKQASGAVTAIQGGTHVFCAACFEKKGDVEPIDFTPLRVDYFERKSSVGRTAGGFIKRDGRPSEGETLTARIIDRPIRPLIADGWSLETQLTAYVLAADDAHMPETMAVCAASASLALSEVCWRAPRQHTPHGSQRNSRRLCTRTVSPRACASRLASCASPPATKPSVPTPCADACVCRR